MSTVGSDASIGYSLRSACGLPCRRYSAALRAHKESGHHQWWLKEPGFFLSLFILIALPARTAVQNSKTTRMYCGMP